MPLKTKQLLDNLQNRIAAGSMSETIRRALALLDAVSKAREEGGELFVHWEDGTQTQIYIL